MWFMHFHVGFLLYNKTCLVVGTNSFHNSSNKIIKIQSLIIFSYFGKFGIKIGFLECILYASKEGNYYLLSRTRLQNS